MTVGFKFQVLAGPPFAFDVASIEFLETIDEPRLLLFKHLNVSMEGEISWSVGDSLGLWI